MSKITIGFGMALVALGLVGYLGAAADHRSITALIPAFVGGPLLLCGLIALKDSLRRDAMHAAAVLGLLGAIAAWGRGLMKVNVLFDAEAAGSRRAVVMVLLMAVICTVFVVLCVQSFIAARRAQRAAGGGD